MTLNAKRLDDGAQHLGSKLLALIMSYDSYLYLTLMSEELMIVHFACHKGISPCFYGVIEQKTASSTTYRHLLYVATQQSICLHAFHMESVLEHTDEVLSYHRFSKVSYYS